MAIKLAERFACGRLWRNQDDGTYGARGCAEGDFLGIVRSELLVMSC